jgi:hypothetical protein
MYMTPRGVCRIIMVAVILLGPGLGSLFQVDYALATAPATTTAVPASLPLPAKSQSVAAAGGTISCSSVAPFQTGNPPFKGIAGQTLDSGTGAGLSGVEVSLVKQDATGNETVLISTTSQGVKLGGATQNGPWSLSLVNVPSDGPNLLTNVTLKFAKIGSLTKYFEDRYDITTSVKLTITVSNDGSNTCLVADSSGAPRLGSITGQVSTIPIDLQGGIAGRVTIPSITIGANDPGQPLLDDGFPITNATVEVHPAGDPNGAPVGSYATSSKSDGYYMIGNLPAGDYQVKFIASGYLPTNGSWWRDGNLPYPFDPEANPTLKDPSGGLPYYFTRTITIFPSELPAFDYHYYKTVMTTTAGTDNGSYIQSDGSYVKGINGHLIQQGFITGTVFNNNNQVLGGAQVELYRVDIVQGANKFTKLDTRTTGPDGTYTFSGVTPGFNFSYAVKAYPPTGVSLIPRWYPSNGQQNAQAFQLTPVPGGTPTKGNVDIILTPGARFVGTVREFGTNVAVPNVKIQIFDTTTPQAVPVPINESTVSQADGSYATQPLLDPDKKYRIAFQPDPAIDNQHITTWCVGPVSGGNCALGNGNTYQAAFDFVPDVNTLADIQANISLLNGFRITGNISTAPAVDWVNTGLSVRAYVYDTQNNLVQTIQVPTPSAGNTSANYTTGALLTGTYKIQFVAADSPSHTGFIPAFYDGSTNGTTNIANAATISLDSNTNLATGKNITLREGGQINLHVEVKDINNTNNPPVPYQNVLVELYGGGTVTTPNKIATGVTDQNGNYSFKGIDTQAPPGQPYILQVVPNPQTQLPVTQTASVTLVQGNGIGVPVWLTKTLQKASAIGGKLYDPANPGYDFSATTINVYKSNKTLYTTLSGANIVYSDTVQHVWRYKLPLESNTYYLGFFAANSSLYPPFFYQNTTDINDPNTQIINLGINQVITNADAIFTPTGRIKFIIHDQGGAIQAGATITLYNASKAPYTGFPVTADAQGQYTTNYLRTGALFPYYAAAEAQGGGAYGYYNNKTGPFNPSNADPIILQPGQIVNGSIDPVSIIITVQTKIVVNGLITLHPSSGVNGPAVGAQVLAVNATNETIVLNGPVTTGADGTYSLVGVPPDQDYKIKVIYPVLPGGNTSPAVFYSNAAAYGSKTLAGGTLFTAQGTSKSNINLTLNAGASMFGVVKSVLNGTSTNLQGATVQVLDPTNTNNVYAAATTDANGQYTLSNLPPGQYKILFKFSNLSAYYLINQTGGTTDVNLASKVTLNDSSPVTINQTFDKNAPPPLSACAIQNAFPVKATSTSVSLQFTGSCMGQAKIYYSLTSFTPSLDQFTYVTPLDGVNGFDHIISTAAGVYQSGPQAGQPAPALPPDTNVYIRVEIYYPDPANNNAPTPYGGMSYPEIVARTAADGTSWYFPYGDSRTSGSSVNTEFLHLFNYSTSASTVATVTYVLTDGLVTRSFVIPAGTRKDIEVSNAADTNSLNASPSATGGRLHGIIVTSDPGKPILAEQTLYNTSSGLSIGGGSTRGGTVLPGTPSLSNLWDFAEGPDTTSNAYNTYYTLLNPDPVNPVCVLPQVFANNDKASGATFAYPVLNIPKSGFISVTATALLAGLNATQKADFGAGFSTRFVTTSGAGCAAGTSANGKFVAEQIIQYDNTQSQERRGIAQEMGALSSAQQWYFLEGLTDKVDSRTYNLLNPNFAATTVTFTVTLDNPPSFGGTITNPLSGFPGNACGAASLVPNTTNQVKVVCTINGNRRLTVNVKDINKPQLGRAFGFSVNMLANQPIVAQRTIRFVYQQFPLKDGLYTQMASNRIANTWLFSAGSTLDDRATNKFTDMALNVYNPNNVAVKLKITYYYSAANGGTPSASDTTSSALYTYLNANSRTTIRPGNAVALNYPSIGPNHYIVATRIESVDDSNAVVGLPISVERLVYSVWTNGLIIGNSSFGYNPPGS